MNKLAFLLLKKKKILLIFAMAFAHLLLSILFACLSLRFLATYNILSTAFYSIVLIFYKNIKDNIFIDLVAVEIPLYAIIVSAFLGNNSGIILYPFAMIIGIFLFSVNETFPIKRYLIISLPSVIAILLITIWPFPQILDAEKYKSLIFVNKVFSSLLAIICIFYLCLSANQDLCISNKKNTKYIEQLKFISNHDPLTKIFNRRSTIKKMNSINVYTIVMFDIDDFKKFNDNYGHEAGDKILIELCNRVSAILPEDAIFSRWGGEEFLVIFPNHSDQSILTITNICNTVSEKEFDLGVISAKITITGGVAISKPGLSLEKLISMADELLYEGKSMGKNQIVFPKSY